MSTVVTGLSELIKTLPIRRFDRFSGAALWVVPEFYFEERSAEQRATQLALRRRYEVLIEILRVILRGAPNDLLSRLEDTDKHFRDWLELNGSWSVTQDPKENARKSVEAARPLQQILDVLDVASKGELILVPDTNSLLSTADPVDYRKVANQDGFVFMLLPTVLGELDRLKIEHRNDVVREKAKKNHHQNQGVENPGIARRRRRCRQVHCGQGARHLTVSPIWIRRSPGLMPKTMMTASLPAFSRCKASILLLT
jgi:hypothetical protein